MKSRRKYKAKMPTLPVEEIARNSELMQKVNWNRGVITAKIAPPLRNFGSGLKHPHHKIMFLLAFFAVLVVVLAGVVMFVGKSGPKSPDQAEKLNYQYPFDPRDVRITSDVQREKFIENFRVANVESDGDKSYKLLVENFQALRGFYAETQSSEYREYMEQLKPFMEKNFGREVDQNQALFSIPCLDALCGEAKMPDEIAALRSEIESNPAIAEAARIGIARTFNSASYAADKGEQSILYINGLSVLFSEYGRTKDNSVKASYGKLLAFLETNYPEQEIPESIKITE